MVKDGLYIENYKADIDDNQVFAFTYSNSDIANPEAIKNTYSKTVTLKGTNTNNKLFGEIWQLDRVIVDDDTRFVGINFNPKKRAKFELYNNGKLLEAGYVCLTDISIENNVITYSLSLFGQLGDFFYNLMYDESDEEITMADLQLGLNEGRSNTFIRWTKNYIKGSWDKMETDFDESDKSIDNWITAAPTYSGFYDDFSNDKVLVEMESMPDEYKADIFPEQILDGKYYRTSYGYGLLTSQREMDEWEVRDLRSMYQRPAIRTRLCLDAIANPANNGGYNVVYSDDIKNSKYYSDSFIIANRLKWEDEATNLTALDIDTDSATYEGTPVTFNLINQKTGNKYFDFSQTDKPQLQLVMNEQIHTNNTSAEKIYSCFLRNTSEGTTSFGWTPNYGGFVYKVKCYINNVHQPDRDMAKIVVLWDDYTLSHKSKTFLINWFKDYVGMENINEQLIGGADRVILPNGDRYYQTQDFTIDFSVPNSENVSFEIEKSYFVSSWYNNNTIISSNEIERIDLRGEYQNKFNPLGSGRNAYKVKKWYSLNYSGTQNNGSVWYDGISSNTQDTEITKEQLFAPLGSPFKILTDFCKLFNLRFRIDNEIDTNPTVFIESRREYFIDDIIDIENNIDHSKSINIMPTTAEYKFYEFGLENEDTYAHILYNKKYNDEYSAYKYNSNYNFNSDTNKIFEDNQFYSGIDYRLNSPYFNTGKMYNNIQYPQICLTPMYEWTLWNAREQSTETLYGLQSFAFLPKVQDKPKICLFDDENNGIDMLCLAFFNGFRDYTDTTINNDMPYLLTDNLPVMTNLNDDSPCYLYGHYNFGDTELIGKKNAGDSFDSVIGLWITKMPIFSPNRIVNEEVNESFYFKVPKAGYTKDNYNNGIMLYNTFWRSYIEDMYDDNAKKVQLNCFLDMKPQEALRRFYFFGNSLWTLNDISDFNYREYQPVECTFVKVMSIGNYMTDFPTYEDTPDTPQPEPVHQYWQKIGYSNIPPIISPMTNEQYNHSVDIYDNWLEKVVELDGDGADEWFEDTNIVYFPKLEMESIDSLSGAWQGCSNLVYVPELNTANCRAFDYAFAGCSALERIESIDFGAVDNGLGYDIFEGCENLTYCLIKNIGANSDCTYLDLSGITGWEYETAMKSLYDCSFNREEEGYYPCQIKLSENIISILSDSDIQAIREKGFIITD